MAKLPASLFNDVIGPVMRAALPAPMSPGPPA